MLTETILGIPFSVISRCSLNADLSLHAGDGKTANLFYSVAAGKMGKNLLVTGGFPI
jgi:hypothetical protein